MSVRRVFTVSMPDAFPPLTATTRELQRALCVFHTLAEPELSFDAFLAWWHSHRDLRETLRGVLTQWEFAYATFQSNEPAMWADFESGRVNSIWRTLSDASFNLELIGAASMTEHQREAVQSTVPEARPARPQLHTSARQHAKAGLQPGAAS